MEKWEWWKLKYPKKLYPIGKHLKMNPVLYFNQWYLNDVVKVIGYEINTQGQKIYTIDKPIPGSVSKKPAGIYPTILIDDYECRVLDRKEKLKTISDFYNK